MTPPPAPAYAGGGVTVTVGLRAAMLTEYAPITVINTSLVDTIYLASDSNVSPGTGVPVAPATSYQWQTPGPLYAVADPASIDGGAAVVLTGSSDTWQPSPVAIGAAIGAQLAAQGITTRLTITQLGTYALPFQGIQGTFSARIDPRSHGLPGLASFGSLLLVLQGPTTATSATPLSYQWEADAGGIVAGPNLLPLGGSTVTGPQVNMTIPVVGDIVRMFNPNTGAGWTVTVYGYNERITDRPIGNGYSLMGFTAATSYAVGETGTKQLVVTAGELFQGPAQCYITVNYAASNPLDAVYVRLSFNGVTGNFNLVGPWQLTTVNPGRYEGSFTRALPAGPYQLWLVTGATAAVAFTVSFEAIPLQ